MVMVMVITVMSDWLVLLRKVPRRGAPPLRISFPGLRRPSWGEPEWIITILRIIILRIIILRIIILRIIILRWSWADDYHLENFYLEKYYLENYYLENYYPENYYLENYYLEVILSRQLSSPFSCPCKQNSQSTSILISFRFLALFWCCTHRCHHHPAILNVGALFKGRPSTCWGG